MDKEQILEPIIIKLPKKKLNGEERTKKPTRT